MKPLYYFVVIDTPTLGSRTIAFFITKDETAETCLLDPEDRIAGIFPVDEKYSKDGTIAALLNLDATLSSDRQIRHALEDIFMAGYEARKPD